MYNEEDLYYCTIDVINPIAIENMGGLVSISGDQKKSYKTIVYKFENECGDNYIDIKHQRRKINLVNTPQDYTPRVSGNGLLYIIKKDTLVPYVEDKNKGSKSKR